MSTTAQVNDNVVLSDYFKRIDTQDGGSRWVFADNCPEWLRDAVYRAHDGMLPNDWIFEQCVHVCDRVDNEGLSVDDVGEYADSQVEVYTKALAQWYAEMCLTDIFSNAEASYSDCNGDNKASIDEQLRGIQYFAIEAIAHTMLQAIEENAEQ